MYGCCGLDAFDGEESAWDEQGRAAYTALLQSDEAPSLMAAIDEALRLLTSDGHLDSSQLNASIVLDDEQGQDVVAYLRRARAGAAGRE